MIASLFNPHRVSARTSLSWPGAIDELHPEERAAVLPMVSGRQAEFAAGRACARAALADLGVTGPVGRAADRSPSWPVGVTGSITHTSGFCIAVAAIVSDHEAAVGIDVENCERMNRALERRILNDVERVDLDLLAPAERQRVVTTIFAAKEAFYKAHYQLVPRYLGFDVVSVRQVDESNLEFTSCSPGISSALLARTRARVVEHDNRVIVGVMIESADEALSVHGAAPTLYADSP